MRTATVTILLVTSFALTGCGGSGSSVAGTGGTGGTGGAGGNPDCAKLNADHAQLLEAAKSCNPALSSPQCTLEAQRDPTCGCSTFVSADQSANVQTLKNIVAQFQALNCGNGMACKCASPTSATCEPASSGGAGTCTDVY